MSFKIGDKVVCINGEEWQTIEGIPNSNGPKYNEILPIDYFEDSFLGFNKYAGSEQHTWCPECFRKVDEHFAENLLAEIEEEINQEQLIAI